MATAHTEQPSPPWSTLRVAIVHGLADKRIDSGEDFETRPLGSLWHLPPTNRPKHSGMAFLPSLYHDYDAREHKAQRERGSFVALVGDIDKGDHPIERIEKTILELFGQCGHFIHATAHAVEGDMRWRTVLPLAQPIPYPEWRDAQEALFDLMRVRGIEMDGVTERAGQVSFLPNVPATHEKTGRTLRDKDGAPLFYMARASDTGAPGLDLTRGPIAGAIADLRRCRAEDDRLREQMRREAERRRANRPANDGESPIDVFNRNNSVVDMLERHGYQQSRSHSEDYRSPQQTSASYATRVMGDKWVSLSGSDAVAGLGSQCASGCYGDAYDLFVFYEHGGDQKAAWKAVCDEQDRPRRQRTIKSDWDFACEVPPSGYEGREQDHQDEKPATKTIEGNPEPIDLWARYEAPKLPKGLLPPIIEQLAFRQGYIMGVDPAGLAMAALTVCAAAISDDIAVKMKRFDDSWTESARLWVGMVGLPSRKKSPVLSIAVRPLARLDGRKMAAYTRAIEERAALPKTDQKDAPLPAMHRHMVSDATIESLQVVLKDSPWGILSEQDELSGWFGGMDKYSGNKGAQADRAFWLKAFNGGRYTIDRIARGSSQIRNLSISLLGGIQPEPLRKVATETVDDGLIQRLLPVILAPATVGHDLPDDGIVSRYDKLVLDLVELRAPAWPGIPTLEQRERSRPLVLSDDARAVRERLEQEHHGLITALENTSPKLAAHFGKYDGLFGRLCVVWHCIEHSEAEVVPVEVTGQTAQSVAGFMERFIRPSAIAFYAGMLGLSDGYDTLISLASYIVAEKVDEVNARVVQRSTHTLRSFTADEARQLCEKLESFGWLVSMDPPSRSNTPRWRVVPAVHEMFAEKGRQEAERRKTAQEALRAAIAA